MSAAVAIEMHSDLRQLATLEVEARGGDDDDINRVLGHLQLASHYGRLDRVVYDGEPVGFIGSIRISRATALRAVEKDKLLFNSRDVDRGGDVCMILEMVALDGHGYSMLRQLARQPGVKYLAGWSAKERVGRRFRVKPVRGR